MNPFRCALILGIGLVVALAYPPPALAVVPPLIAPRTPAARVSKLIAAIEKSDYSAFVADCDPALPTATKDRFESIAARFGARLKNRHEVSPLGVLKKQGQEVTLWKVKFLDGGDDLLVTLSLDNDKLTDFRIN